MQNSRFVLENNGGAGALTYTLMPDESIVMFDHGMIMNNSLKGLLGYVYENRGDRVVLSYAIRRGTRLSLLKNSNLKKQAVLKILMGIADIVILCGDYMLEETHLCFDDDTILVDVSNYSVYIPYVPTTGFVGKRFSAFLKDVIINGVFDSDADDYLMKLLRVLNSNPNVSAQELKKTLEAMLNEPAMSSVPDSGYAQSGAVGFNSQPQPVQPQPEKPVLGQGGVDVLSFAQPEAPENAPEAKNKWWQKKEKPVKEKKQKASTSAVGGTGGFAGMSFPGSEDMFAATPAPAPTPAPASTPVSPWDSAPIVNQGGWGAQNPVQQPTGGAPVYPIPQSGAQNTAQTADDDDDVGYTVLRQPSAAKSVSAYLVSRQGERIAITKSGFTIGKDPKASIANDHVIKKIPSVSRNHAMITMENGVYFVTDMTSLNGTFVNGSRINSGVPCRINSGDDIAFSDAQFTFVIE